MRGALLSAGGRPARRGAARPGPAFDRGACARVARGRGAPPAAPRALLPGRLPPQLAACEDPAALLGAARLALPCPAGGGLRRRERRGPGPRPEVRGAAGLAVPRRTPALKAGPKRGGKSCFVVGAFSGFGGFSWGFLAVRKPALAGQALWGNAPLLPYLFRLVPTLSGRAPSETPRPPHTLPSPAWAPVQASSVSVCPADSPPQRRLLSRRKCYL